MIETRVRVLSTDAGLAWVEPTEQNACGACQAKSACAISEPITGLGRFFASRRQPIAIPAEHVRAGDQLTLRMREADFLKVGVLAYLLPSVLALAGALAGSGGGDLRAVLGMALGFGLGLLIARGLAGRVAPPASLSSHQGEST